MYDKMYEFVKDSLIKNDGEITKVGCFHFRKRSEHIRRVFIWAERITEGDESINREAVLTAAMFHDVGYGLTSDDERHAENSAILCERYLRQNGYDAQFTDFVTYLVKNHSNKEMMLKSDTPMELILLMEADLLDETGALSIVWDCMMEGSQQIQSFEKTFNHILNYTDKSMEGNPMITAKAKEFWTRKQEITRDFIGHLSLDLGIDSTVL